MPKNTYPNDISFFNHKISTKISLKSDFKIERKAMRAMASNDPRQDYLSTEIQDKYTIQYEDEDNVFLKTSGKTMKGEYIFVLTCEETPRLLCHKNKHHSFLANGKKVLAAGTLLFDDGKLIEITNNSGHYKPTDEEMFSVIKALYKASEETLEYFISYCTEVPKIYSVSALVENDCMDNAVPLACRKPVDRPTDHYDRTALSDSTQPENKTTDRRFGRSLCQALITEYQIILGSEVLEEMKDRMALQSITVS